MIATLFVSALLAAQSGSDACAGAEGPLKEGSAALVKRDLERAAAVLGPLESDYMTCGKVLLALGRLKYEQGEYRRAATLSELALLAAPENAEALLLRGQMLLLQGRENQAEELLQKACKLEPANAGAHYALGMLYDGRRRNAEAVAEFEKTVELRPDDARAWDYLALNLEPIGEIARAETAYRKALEANGGPLKDRFVSYNYGRLLLKLNRLPESRKYLDEATRSAPQTRAVWYEHARLNLRLGNIAEARTDGERALELRDPGGYILDLQVYNLLVQIYMRLGDRDSAAKYAQLSESAKVPARGRERK